jgi:BirA family biotin operon repressor/biotin-[acetyl-CoA-carboxylase] ligase
MLNARQLSNPARRILGPRIVVLEECASTNDEAFARLSADGAAGEGIVIFAEHQTAGRGQRGRVWHSRPGLGLLFSVAFWAPRPPAAPALVAASALAIRDATGRIAGLGARTKWPNDLYINNRKYCGILVEAKSAGARAVIVVGIGVNLNHDPQTEFAPGIRDLATSLRHESGREIDRHAFAHAALDGLDHYLSQALEFRYADIEREFLDSLQLCDTRVAVESPAGTSEGVLAAFDCTRGVALREASGLRWHAAETISRLYAT